MTYLPDVNVWVALAVGEHVQHAAAKAWLDDCAASVAFCRVTQMGLLRLLTNSRVMAGDALSAARAWNVLDAFCEDGRVLFVPEPSGLEDRWRAITKRPNTGPNFWTDAYLAAFAATMEFTVVTFDKSFRQHKGVAVHIPGGR